MGARRMSLNQNFINSDNNDQANFRIAAEFGTESRKYWLGEYDS